MGASDICIVDVRGQDEYMGEFGHIKGSLLIPLPELPNRIAELPKNKTIVAVCRSGGRSARAAMLLMQNGFSPVYSLAGGMMNWNDEGLPVER
jgi:hydroxyacylglutathione hydrolase